MPRTEHNGREPWLPRLPGADGLMLGAFTGTRRDAAGGVAVFPDGRSMAIGHADGRVRRVSLVTGEDLWVAEEPHEPVLQDVACSRRGTLVASCAEDRRVKLWSAGEGELIGVLEHPASVNEVCFSPGDEHLATACDDGTVRVWALATNGEVTVCRGHEAWVVAVAWSPCGDLLASASNDATVRIFRAADGAELHCWESETRPASVRWSPSGDRLAVVWEDGVVAVRERATWSEAQRWNAHGEPINCVAWSPDGRLLATGSNDETVRIWDGGTARELQRLAFREPFAWRLSWSPGGEFLAASLGGDVVRLWQVLLAG